MLFYLSLIAASPFLITAFPQNSDDASIVQVDGFVFNGPASGQANGEQRITSTSTPTIVTTLSIDLYNTCIENCPTTFEYNPVCGTDKVDYTNPGGLGCAQRCGKDVTLNYYGRCSTAKTG